MKHFMKLLCAGAAFAAGVGPVAAGEVMSRWGAIAMVPAASGEGLEVRVESVHGWVCEGLYAHPSKAGAAVGFPLTCSDRVEGEALMSVEDGLAVMAFNRDDGTHGSAKLRLE
ncbi:hypothetical protein C0V75_16885 [Tabrizicola sp. TH137]|uniref:hypothetical protein n=1 Tax=Tabrizicola sp. TH137 TaxID=2067452 RepID=UPI000C7E0A81|nr:hypothetical protein [Tabrizicola sp. TH137]PLL10980.1 hypothetical protein C0V75_16885 [Tabrizicola sp. TH137]